MRNKYFEAEQLNRIYWLIDQDKMNPGNILVEILAISGMRTDELMRVMFRDVDVRHCSITVFKAAKDSESRTCPIPMSLAVRIQDAMDLYGMSQWDLLVSMRSHKETCKQSAARYLRKHFEKMKAYLFIGVKVPGLHGFRHTVAKKVLESTRGNIYATKQALGHKSVTTTEQCYSSGYKSRELEAILGKR